MNPKADDGQRCVRCGHDASICPVCKGDGEVVVRDERAYERRNRLFDPPSEFDVPVRCEHCDGTGKHVCIEGRCHCGKPSVYYDPDAEELLCGQHAAEAVGEELARALSAVGAIRPVTDLRGQ
jgi:RecJ-like exonuclease